MCDLEADMEVTFYELIFYLMDCNFEIIYKLFHYIISIYRLFRSNNLLRLFRLNIPITLPKPNEFGALSSITTPISHINMHSDPMTLVEEGVSHEVVQHVAAFVE